MLKKWPKRTARMRIVTVHLAIIFSIVLFYSSISVAQAQKEGEVIHASNVGGFVFINLGEGDVNEGDLVQVYRDSNFQGTFKVKFVMANMSEAWVTDESQELAIKVGDRAVISEQPAGAPRVAEVAPPRM